MPLTLALLLCGALVQSNPAEHVLLVINQASFDSTQIGAHYRAKREVPRDNVLFIDVSRTEEVTNSEYLSAIETPVRTKIKSLRNRIDFIVLTKGVPIRIKEGGFAVDAMLAAMNLAFKPIDKVEEDVIRRAINPYFNKDEPFDSAKFGFYLVTRLDGYTVDDAKRLVDNSLAARPEKGPFLFDEAENRKNGGYLEIQDTLGKAASKLKGKGYEVRVDSTAAFVVPDEPVMGYAGWGSNDRDYEPEAYKRIRFKAGSICETFVSTSGRTFAQLSPLNKSEGQSLVTDLIAAGVTGIKAYVSEPYTFALAKPEILFDRYTSGRNLAESFYAASMVLKWKDVVIGDPLCSPYATR